MASIVKRGKSWRAVVRTKGQTHTKTFTTKAEANIWATDLEKSIIAGTLNKTPNKTFGELLEKYSDEVSPTKRGCKWEQTRINLFCTYDIAKVNLRELDATHFAQWRNDRLSKVSNATVLREWNILSNALKFAINEWKWLTSNPLKEISRPKKPAPRDRLITDNEINLICYSADYHKDKPPLTNTARVAAIMLFAIETGMRLKEMTRLNWDFVYLDKSYVHVTDDSKTGRRDVALSPEAIRILKQLHEIKDGDLVFNLNEAQVDSLFRKLRTRMNLSGFTFHDTKHLACTRLAQKINVFDLARMLGTRDLKTLAIYYNASATDIAKKL